MNYSRSASHWWTNRLVDVNRKAKNQFARKLREEVEVITIEYGHCKLSSEPKANSILQKVLQECNIPSDKVPFGVSMDVWENRIWVFHNGGRRETVFEV